MKKKILFVVTNHYRLGTTGRPTGFWLSEAAHPYSVLSPDFDIDFVSPCGGAAPLDGFDLTDETCRKLWCDPTFQQKISHTLTTSEVKPSDYVAIFYVGGHGGMWDYPTNSFLAKIAQEIYEAGGYVAAVCHGPAGLMDIRLSDGSYLIKGKRFDCFTNAEEQANGTANDVPFALQTELENRGGIFDGAPLWADHVVVDGRLLTGQNPMSALSLGKALSAALKQN